MDINSLLNKPAAAAVQPAATPAPFPGTDPFADAFAGLDAAVSKAASFEGLEAGKYLVKINGANFKVNQNGNINLSVEYGVIDGAKAGRKEWQHMTMKFGADWNARGIGDFATIVAAVSGADIAAAKAFVANEIKKFVTSGEDKMAVEGLTGTTGELAITVTKSTKDGVDKEYRNYKFVAKA